MRLPECKFEKYIFAVTGMSYIIDSSGTSKAVQAHESIFIAQGIGFIAIFPISRSSGEGSSWHVRTTGCYAFVIDGQFIGVMTAIEVLNSLLTFQEQGKACIGVLVHHIYRNDIAELQWMLEKTRNVPVWYYLHDFYTCCINPYMLKNDTESCLNGGASCEDCVYHEKRQIHLAQVNGFLGSFGDRISFIAPSEFVKNRWITYHPEYADRVIVIPHQKSVGRYMDNKEIISDDEQVRIGFVGKQIHIKGWDIFKKTVEKLQAANCHYEYSYFGSDQEQLPGVTNIPVEISKTGKDSMIRALREKHVHAVFLTCVVGETYSYTMYESHAANSYIVTMSNSGNIAYTVKTEKWGKVFDTEEELFNALLDEKEFRKTVNEWRTETEPGAAAYEDNAEILRLFRTETAGKIDWKKKKSTMNKTTKRAVLHMMFVITRLKGRK